MRMRMVLQGRLHSRQVARLWTPRLVRTGAGRGDTLYPEQAAREERRARERAERAARGEDEDAEPVARIVAYSDRCVCARCRPGAVEAESTGLHARGGGHSNPQCLWLPAHQALHHMACTTSLSLRCRLCEEGRRPSRS